MKNKVLLIIQCLLVQAFFGCCGWLSAQTQPLDTLSWSWEVTTTTSTKTKTCVLEFADSVRVDWGDGTVEWINDSLSKENLTHYYSMVGNYSCLATGTLLTYFKADSRRLLSLHPEKAPNLTYISCSSSQLSGLDLSRNTKLESLYCGGNNLQTLNLAANIRLQTLTCSDNKLTGLDLSGLSQLKKVTCHTNPLTRLSVNSSGVLNYLSCSACSLSIQALDSLFEQLPILSEISTNQNLFISGNPGTADCHPEQALAKKWTLETNQTKSLVSMPSVSVKIGNTAVVAVHLANVTPLVAFEMDVALPDGLFLDTLRSTLVASRIAGHRLSIAKVSTNPTVYKFMTYSMTSKDTLLGRNGAILNLYINVLDTVRTYTIDIKKVILADTAANPAEVSMSDGKLSVLPRYTVGDADNDDRVNVTDIVWLVALINGRCPFVCQKEAIDMDENGVWNILDVVRMVDVINATTYSVASPAGRINSVSPANESAASGVLLKQPYHLDQASPSNHIYLTQSKEDPTLLDICLDNHDAVQAMQVDVVLPEDVSLVLEETSLSPRCASSHTLKLVPVSADGRRYRLVLWSMSTGKSFSGNSGTLVSLRIHPRNMETKLVQDVRKGYLDQSVLTGLEMTTVQSFSYETELDVSGKQSSVKASVGSGTNGQLWVKGENLRRITVIDMMSRMVADMAGFGGTTCTTTVNPGCYLVKVEQNNGSSAVFKILVP